MKYWYFPTDGIIVRLGEEWFQYWNGISKQWVADPEIGHDLIDGVIAHPISEDEALRRIEKGTDRMAPAAHELAKKAHAGQTDKAGKPYILHPEYVADHLWRDDLQAVGYLHDILEDTDITADDLWEYGFSREVIDAVTVITKVPGEDYADYIRRVKQNPLARPVKIADMTHNSDLSRLDSVTDEDIARQKKYSRAIQYLKKIEIPEEIKARRARRLQTNLLEK